MIICALEDESKINHYLVEQKTFKNVSELVYALSCRYHDITKSKHVAIEFEKVEYKNGTFSTSPRNLDEGTLFFKLRTAWNQTH